MIRVLKFTSSRKLEERSLPESIHISVSDVLTQDAAIVGDLYLDGFIPAKVISATDVHCNYSDMEELLLKYDDQYLVSYDVDLGVATTPLTKKDVAGLVRDTTEIRFLKAYAESLVP